MKICPLIFEQILGTPVRGYEGRFAGQTTTKRDVGSTVPFCRTNGRNARLVSSITCPPAAEAAEVYPPSVRSWRLSAPYWR